MAVYQDYLADKHALDEVLKGVENLVSIPEVYLKFRQLMDQPNTALSEYSQVVSCDPKLAALVLKFVNSPLYGFSGRVGHLDDAIRLIGLNKLYNLVLAAAMVKLDYPNEIMPLKVFWRCSLFAGILARALGKKLKLEDTEGLFVCGLLHKIGALILYAKYPEQAQQALLTAKEHDLSLSQAQQQVLGFHYGQVGAKLMALWRLPVELQVVTYYHPRPQEAPILLQKTALLHLVHSYSQRRLHPDEPDLAESVAPEAWRLAGCQPEHVDSVLAEAEELTVGLEQMVLN